MTPLAWVCAGVFVVILVGEIVALVVLLVRRWRK